MYILFTTSDKPMACLIRWATGDCCSHVALLVDGSIIHSNFKGVNTLPLLDFLEENRVIHSIEIEDNPVRLQELLDRDTGKWYDIGALLFSGIMLFCRKALGLRKWPKQNLWQSSGMYMCTEFVTEYIDGKQDSMITPHQLFVRLSNK